MFFFDLPHCSACTAFSHTPFFSSRLVNNSWDINKYMDDLLLRLLAVAVAVAPTVSVSFHSSLVAGVCMQKSKNQPRLRKYLSGCRRLSRSGSRRAALSFSVWLFHLLLFWFLAFRNVKLDSLKSCRCFCYIGCLNCFPLPLCCS